MGAKILDWMAVNKRECVAFVLGLILGGVLGNLGWFVQSVK
jgi:lipoprotein signal peptidase